MTALDALHSSETSEHYTPRAIVEAARATLGGVIDLDPFSCAKANEVVQARHFYGEEEDGFAMQYAGNVFVNPPGGKYAITAAGDVVRAVDLPGLPLSRYLSGAAIAWWHLLDEWNAGRVKQALFVCFSMNVFQTSQRFEYLPPCAYPFCVPSSRIPYDKADGKSGKSPPHPSAFAYLPRRCEWPSTAPFREAFSPFGYVRT